ncbi:MAG: sulfoxide reductase heme-binding subunit YedZ [Chloroflexi bacterium]|nr:sulfoxide reductase heme-binding subunit YedZ [Chloroflexota bacterium]
MLHALRTQWLRVVVHIGAWIPFAVIVWDALTNQLGAEPIRETILRTGKTALILLVLSLACTPANTLFGFKSALKVRRALGLYAFFYALAHATMFIGVDYGFDLALLQGALLERPYALVGAAAFLILLPLALTSTKGWMKRLGRRWTMLHRGVYLAALLVIAHFVWLVKLDVREPLTYGAIVLLLLALRIRLIREGVVRLRAL